MEKGNLVRQKIKEMDKSGRLDILRNCSSLEDRNRKLIEFVPEIRGHWDPNFSRNFTIILQRDYGIDFGI